MENRNNNPENEKDQSADQEETQFENPSVDPGFGNEEELTGLEDEREGDIDSNKSVSDIRKEGEQNDALNYKNDRENGAYNPKNI